MSASGQAVPPERAQVVVVGAGLAGLAAALALHEAGRDVQLLEARERVGGRVWTVREPFEAGLYAEAGAEFISPGHATVRRYLRRYGLLARPRRSGARAFYFGGQRRDGLSLDECGDTVPQDGERLGEALRALGRRVPRPSSAWLAPEADALDKRSAGDWLDDLALHPLVRAQQRSWMTGDYGVEPERLSLLMLARDERLLAPTANGETRCVLGGMDQLPRAMAAELEGRVRTGMRVTGLRHDDRGAEVFLVHAGRRRRLNAAHVVLALPLPILRQLAIEPALPSERQRALGAMGISQVLKVLLQFSRRVWREQGVDGLWTDLEIRAAYDATIAQPGERGILTLYIAGQAASALAGLSERERIARCLAQLDQVLPGCAAALERAQSIIWERDPLAGGAYSFFAPGSFTRDAPLLARPLGRLHFAGEYADRWQSTMNGALESGLRAARQVVGSTGRV